MQRSAKPSTSLPNWRETAAAQPILCGEITPLIRYYRRCTRWEKGLLSILNSVNLRVSNWWDIILYIIKYRISHHGCYFFQAWEDYLHGQQTDKKILKRINELIKPLAVTPLQELANPNRYQQSRNAPAFRHGDIRRGGIIDFGKALPT